MIFRRAEQAELGRVDELYRSVKGGKFCFWDEAYPGMEDIRHDFAADGLFVMLQGDRVIGACSVVPENELDALPFWTVSGGDCREIARVAVAESFQGRGVAAVMVSSVIAELSRQGCRMVHLAAAAGNLPALKLYKKTGFSVVGETEMYGGRYLLLEKAI